VYTTKPLILNSYERPFLDLKVAGPAHILYVVGVVTNAPSGVLNSGTIDASTRRSIGAVKEPPQASPKYLEIVSLLNVVFCVNGKPVKFKSLAVPLGAAMVDHVNVTPVAL